MYNFDFSFHSREQYLTKRNEWRRAYDELSNDIRIAKQTVCDNAPHRYVGMDQSALTRRQAEATDMLKRYQDAKDLGKQRRAAAWPTEGP